MRQILQNLKDGDTLLAELPAPALRPGHLLIRTQASVISVGTERMFVDFGKANLLDKARQQPDKVKQVLDKVRTAGLLTTLDAVRSKLDSNFPLGYSNAGLVVAVGAGVPGFEVGDRVVSNGPHAEVVAVPHRLCARIPDGVAYEDAAYTVVASIGLQGIRLIEPTLGELVVVTGLGLIGLITVQLLRAHGCRVLGVDLDAGRCARARALGAEVVDLSTGADPVAAAAAFSRGAGVDAVVITASTKSHEPMHQAAEMCRKRGRIVLVGVVGLELQRADFYEKELSFQVSCSYGPGRYDPEYEMGGHDYPLGFVRWTEQRNFEAILDLMASGQLDVATLTTDTTELAAAPATYGRIAANEPVLGAVIRYPVHEDAAPPELLATTVELNPASSAGPGRAVLGMIGAGNFGGNVLGPAFKDAGARLRTVASSGGVSGSHAGRKLGFERTTTDLDALFGDEAIDTVAIATRHGSHAGLVLRALGSGRNVYVEKPLALTLPDLAAIEAELSAANPRPLLMVGFNRRFSPHTIKVKQLLASLREPKSVIMTVNAGAIPADHWVHDKEAGGGRVLGEGCHFIDLARHLVGAPIVGLQATAMGAVPGLATWDDKATLTLRFGDGSFAAIHYLANGHRAVPKERIEVYCAERVLRIDDFRSVEGFGWPGLRKSRALRQDKGNKAAVAAFVDAVRRGGEPPIPVHELLEVSRWTIEAALQIEASARG
jgi:predicted dehydrogenase/threonine dehydrogenase-like Zn-dependent dehydrogenase